MKKPILRKYFIKSIGILLFVIILLSLDFNKLIETLQHFNYKLLLISVPVFFTLIFIKTYRWYLIGAAQGINNLNLYQMYRVYNESYFAGAVTPGRLGEAIKYQYINSKGFSVLESLYSVIMDRLYDIVILFLVAYIGMFYFISYFKNEIVLISFFFVGVFLLMFILAYKRQWVLTVFLRVIYKITGKKLESGDCNYMDLIKKTKFTALLPILLLSLAGWMLYYYQMLLFAKGLNIDISYLQISLCVSISSFFSMIPITVSGIGTRDASLIFLFGSLGLSKEQAILFSFMILVIFILNSLLSIPFWLLKKDSPVPG